MKLAGMILVVIGAVWLGGCQAPSSQARRSSYPIGIYSVPTTNDFRVIREAGFNLIAGRAEKSYLDAAQAAGLRVLAAPGTSAGVSFNAAAARRAVWDFDGHPALWAWYLVDEPDLNQIAPDAVRDAHRFVKFVGARKPTALVIFQGYEAAHYGRLSDIMMIDRYPVPWLPLANFGQHVQFTRLALPPKKPLVAVIQAFDWSCVPELLPGETGLRPPTYEEIRCMTYEALARGATGLFYYSFHDGRWDIQAHPATWEALKRVVAEVNARQPLFQAQHCWWPKEHRFRDRTQRFNAALESSVTSRLLRVKAGSATLSAGDYILAINNTERAQGYSFTLPPPPGEGVRPAPAHPPNRGVPGRDVPVLGEARTVSAQDNWLSDEFAPYAVHIYGPLR